jgi:ABC-2 type transport system permease protein
MLAMIIKEFRELRRDRRTLAMLLALPVLLLIVFGYAANFHITSLTAAVVGPGAAHVEQQIAANPQAAGHLDIVATDPSGDVAAARSYLADAKANVAVYVGGAKPVVYIDGSSLFAAQSAQVLVASLGSKVDSEILFNPQLKTSWVMVPALVGLILTFIGMLVTSIGLVKERQNGTLEQLAVMPFRPSAVIAGKIAPYFVLAAADMLAVTLLGVWIFKVPFNGSPLLFALGGAIFLFVVLGLGVLISTISQTVGQAIQTAMFVLMPQILLSGFIFPLAAMPAGVRWIGYLLPLTYFAKISQGIMLRGAGLSSLWPAFVILTVMAVVAFGAAVLRFQRSIAPVRSRAGRSPGGKLGDGTAEQGVEVLKGATP